MLPPDAHKLVIRAIEQAKADGEDWLDQNKRAIAALLSAHPHLSEMDAARLVLKLRA